MFFRIFKESVLQAVGQLTANRLRSFLSLLGIAIGIFCYIAVKSSVNSLEDNIRSSFKKIGDDVLYVTKMPWNEDPDDNYWKYARRPNPSFADYKILTERLQSAKDVSFFLILGGKTIKYGTNSNEGTFGIAATYEFGDLHNMEYEAGRYFSSQEYNSGARRVLLGSVAAEDLFGTIDPVGKEIKMMGQTLTVIGVIKRSGKSLLKPFNFDNAAIVSYEFARSVVNVKPNFPWGTQLEVRAKADVPLDKLRDEIVSTLRAGHRLPPREKDDFSINELSIIAEAVGGFFGVLNLVGVVVGGFALIVGAFSVANIMFVSVKERTNIIGIKKALGAKNSVILTEFLIESIILCIFGGILGLIITFGILKLVSLISAFDIYISWSNVLWGVGISIIVGIIAGIIPAAQAAKLDPVEAIRS